MKTQQETKKNFDFGKLFKASPSQKRKPRRKPKHNNAVSITFGDKQIYFYSINGDDKSSIRCETIEYRAKLYSDEFYTAFLEKLNEYISSHPFILDADVTVVLEDRVIATDTIALPTLRRTMIDQTLDIKIESMYRNNKELEINSKLAVQNKKHTLFELNIVRKEILEKLANVFEQTQIQDINISYESATSANALGNLIPRLRNGNYMLADIHEENTNYIFVAKGNAIGHYSIPFGYSILQKRHVASEDMLFDHSTAELVVLNAKERAKAKQLTMMDGADMQEYQDYGQLDNPEDEYNEYNSTQNAVDRTIKILPKKTPRKLPKFMLRPDPVGESAIEYENFRIFVKWALNLIQGNELLKVYGMPESVYVNMPEEFKHVIDKTNEEKDENGISFAYLDFHNESENVTQNLDLYGGLYAYTIDDNSMFMI